MLKTEGRDGARAGSMATFTSFDDVDPAFLSAIAEAEAGAAKLRRLSKDQSSRRSCNPCENVCSSTSFPAASSQRGHPPAPIYEVPAKRIKAGPEGEYLAALRGTHSETWQAMNVNNKIKPDGRSKSMASSSSSSSSSSATLRSDGAKLAGDACFHCGEGGHWARDCPAKPLGNVAWESGNNNNMPQVADKQCPCGAGMCKVLTANTEKNNGRQFYKCPLRKEEGQCGFFEWCHSAVPIGFTEGNSRDREQNNVQFVEIPCPCGAGPCAMLTAKTEKNMGRQFLKCPRNQGEGACGFFKWCDENSSSLISAPTSLAYGNIFQERSASSPQTPSGQCYKCGMGGHWAKDCTNQSNQNMQGYTNHTKTGNNHHQPLGSATATGVTCYKCGQVGHWANTCGMQHSQPCRSARGGSYGEFANLPAAGGSVGGSAGNTNADSGGCFKCGERGHWSRDCPGVSNGRLSNSAGGQYEIAPPFSSKTTTNGSCFKCGGQGHWANECRGS